MGMSVKGLNEHRLVKRGVEALLTDLQAVVILSADERAALERLRKRADLAIDRIKRRKDGGARPRFATA